jgi:hypothetical protein
MKLPKIAVPMFNIDLPSTGKPIAMKSMRTAEYKILLIAKETNNNEQIITAIKQVLNNCICDSKIDVDNLSWYDAEWLFVKLIVSSKADKMVKLSYKCNISKEDKSKCDTINNIEINIDEVKINVDKNELLLKALDESGTDIVMKFVYPTLSDIEKFKNLSSEIDKMDIFNELLVAVSVGNDLFIKNKDFGSAEAEDLINSLSDDHIKELLTFIKNMPVLKLDYDFICTGCGHKHNVVLKGIKDFF